MKPTVKRAAWPLEDASKRVQRCLLFLRAADLLTEQERDTILKRVSVWKYDHSGGKATKYRSDSRGAPAMRDTIEARFQQFHSDNPQVFQYLVKLTHEQHLHGKRRFGLKAMWEQIRWRIFLGDIQVQGEHRLNNDFTSRYVRTLVEKHPAYRGLFNLRALRSP